MGRARFQAVDPRRSVLPECYDRQTWIVFFGSGEIAAFESQRVAGGARQRPLHVLALHVCRLADLTERKRARQENVVARRLSGQLRRSRYKQLVAILKIVASPLD